MYVCIYIYIEKSLSLSIYIYMYTCIVKKVGFSRPQAELKALEFEGFRVYGVVFVVRGSWISMER